VEAVQRAAPGAVVGIVWTRLDLVSGLQWEEISSSMPATGARITSAKLAAALQTKFAFAKAEYDTFSISKLYVEAGASYFKPVDGGAAVRRQMRKAVLSRIVEEIE